MKKIVKIINIVHTLLILQFILYNDSYSAFREINFTARSAGLSGAFCTIKDDVSVVIYNPAGIGSDIKCELNFSYTKLFSGLEDVDIKLNYIGVGIPVKLFNTGITYSELSESSYKEQVGILTIGKEISSFVNNIYDLDIKIFSGINFKYLRNQFILDQRTVNDPVFAKGNSKDNYTIDLGFLFIKDKISVGISGKNLTQPNVGFVNEEILPIELRLGLGYKFSRSFLLFDVSYRNQEYGNSEDKVNVYLGFETEIFRDVLSIVSGVNMTEFGCGFLFRIPVKTTFDSYINFSFNYPFYLMNTSGNYRVGLVIKI